MDRFLHSLVFCLLLLGSAGCSVMDELDKANSAMGTQAQKEKPEAAADDDSIAAQALKTKTELLEQSKEWWGEATSLSPKAVDSKIVGCRLHGQTQFMAKDDCLVRGGRPEGVSG